MTYNMIMVWSNLREIMRLADVGARYEQAVATTFSGRDLEIEVPTERFSDRFRITPLPHQLDVSPHRSTNRNERELA